VSWRSARLPPAIPIEVPHAADRLGLREITVTLILTCATREYVVQASDRRISWNDPSREPYDQGKAIFYCGRIAVAYTGVANIEGDTARWLAHVLAKATDIEAGLDSIGAASGAYFARERLNIPHFVVATGWAKSQGQPPAGMPFIAASSNTYGNSLHEFRTRVNFVRPGVPFLGYDFGQPLKREERGNLYAAVRSALKFKTAPESIAQAFAAQIRLVASGNDDRASKVSRAVLVKCLSRSAIRTGEGGSIFSGIGPNFNGCVYLAEDGSVAEWKTPWIACGGSVVSGGGGTIPPGGKGRIRAEMEESARRSPIGVPPGATKYSAPCPFCAAEMRRRGLSEPSQIVEGELPMSDEEAWIYCRGQTGHLLLVKRSR
jgi:hypothetical protein